MDKINEVTKILSKYSLTKINIPDHLADTIYDLFINNIKCDVDLLDKQLDNDIMYLFIGIYYENIEKNYELSKKYYLMARAGRSVDCCSATGY
jgi:hypothetical protein